MSTPKPFVSDEQIAQYASQYVLPYASEVKRACEHMRNLYEPHVQQLVRERDEALAKVAKAEEALRPFAEGYEQVKSCHTPTWEQRIGENAILFGYCGFDLRIDHLRNAAAVLTPNTPPSNG